MRQPESGRAPGRMRRAMLLGLDDHGPALGRHLCAQTRSGDPAADVKLAAVFALWFSPQSTIKFLVLMSLAGGVLTLVVLAWHRAKRREGRPEIPYGVAIAFGGLAILGQILAQRFLNHFA